MGSFNAGRQTHNISARNSAVIFSDIFHGRVSVTVDAVPTHDIEITSRPALVTRPRGSGDVTPPGHVVDVVTSSVIIGRPLPADVDSYIMDPQRRRRLIGLQRRRAVVRTRRPGGRSP